MREEKCDIEPGNEIEQKDTRNKCVLGRDEIKHQQSSAGGGLPETESMRAQQFVLKKKVFGTAQCFQSQSQHEHPAVNAVTAPGQRAARRVKGDHDPDADPEKRGDDDDLAKQEEAVKSFRPLRDHVLFCPAEHESTRWPHCFNSC